MGEKGFTVIELLTVVAVVAILVTAFAFQFEGWQGNYRIESQTKEMYVDLLNARASAMQTNLAHFTVVAANNYQVFQDNLGAGTVGAYDAGVDTAVRGFANAKPLEFPVMLGAGTVSFDTRGIVTPNVTIRFNPNNNTPDYDCLVIFTTRINMGKWNGTCETK